MKPFVKKSILFLKTHRFVTIALCGAVIIVTTTGIAYALITNTDNKFANETQTDSQTQSTNSKKSIPDTNTQQPDKPSDGEQPAPPTNPQTTPPANAQTPPAPAPTPFTSVSATISALISCSDNKVTLSVINGLFATSSKAGGTILWHVESNDGSAISATFTTTVSAGSMSAVATQSGTPSPMYITNDAHDGQSVRIRVTSPNNTTSAWYTVPTGKQAECFNHLP